MSNFADSFILQALGIVIAAGALLASLIRAWAAILPLWLEYQNRKILAKHIGQGPFDSATIKRATRYYLRPSFTNVDPSLELEHRTALAAARDDLFKTVERWLTTPGDRRHMLILADSGIGKSAFLLNYYAHNERLSARRRQKISLVALGDRDADRWIREIPEKSSRVIFLDALDEDVRAIRNHRRRIGDLMELCKDFRAVVLTCRTQFFLRDEEIPRDVGIVRVGPRDAAEGGYYEFWKLYLAPFDEADVEKYLRRRYPPWSYRRRRKVRRLVRLIPKLVLRPMLLAHVPKVVDEKHGIRYSCELYSIMIRDWLEREKGWVDPRMLRRFSEVLAVDLFVNREQRGMEAMPADELEKTAATIGLPQLRKWQLTGRSLLNRDAQGNYKFSHRSIMEFLLLEGWSRGRHLPDGTRLTDQMASFIYEKMSANHCSYALPAMLPRELTVRNNPEKYLDHMLLHVQSELRDASPETPNLGLLLNRSRFSCIPCGDGAAVVFTFPGKTWALKAVRAYAGTKKQFQVPFLISHGENLRRIEGTALNLLRLRAGRAGTATQVPRSPDVGTHG